MAGYSASEAAAHSLTQELRPVLAAQGISVHGVYPGEISKTSPTRTRKRWRVLWRIDPKAFERAFCGAVAA